MKKKLLATVLASTMVLGSVSAYAADPTAPTLTGDTVVVSGSDVVTKGQAIDVKTTVAAVEIKVTIPTQVEMLLNPYEMGTDIPQIASPEYSITNNSDTAVNAILSGWNVTMGNTDVKTAPTVALSPIDPVKSLKKEAFIWLAGAPETLPTENFDSVKDKAKVVPAKTTTTPLAVSYGVVPKTKALKLQFRGNLSNKVVWNTTDTISASPVFRFEPTVVQ